MSRTEQLLTALLNGETVDIKPRSRLEQYLKNCCDKCGCDGLPKPRARVEILLYQLAEQLAGGSSGGGSEPVIEPLSLTSNGTYTAPSGVDGYSPVTVSVGEDRLNLFFTKQMTEVTETDLSGLTTISEVLFKDFSLLKSLNIPSTITTIGTQAFMNCVALEYLYIPDSVVSIGQSAFHTCSSLATLRLPANVSVGDYCFQNAIVSTLLIPQGTTIGRSSFHSCKIQELTIAQGATLGENTFYNCASLRKIVVTATTPPTIQSNTFNQCTALASIEVPKASLSAFKAATNWSAYADIIVGV